MGRRCRPLLLASRPAARASPQGASRLRLMGAGSTGPLHINITAAPTVRVRWLDFFRRHRGGFFVSGSMSLLFGQGDAVVVDGVEVSQHHGRLQWDIGGTDTVAVRVVILAGVVRMHPVVQGGGDHAHGPVIEARCGGKAYLVAPFTEHRHPTNVGNVFAIGGEVAAELTGVFKQVLADIGTNKSVVFAAAVYLMGNSPEETVPIADLVGAFGMKPVKA